MLRILYGTAGTGKSAAIMDETRRGADSGERYNLLVPEQYSHEAERELCAVCGDGLSLYAEVLSFTGLAREVSSECGGAANEYLDKGGRLLCMALAADGLYSRLHVYGAARRKVGVFKTQRIEAILPAILLNSAFVADAKIPLVRLYARGVKNPDNVRQFAKQGGLVGFQPDGHKPSTAMALSSGALSPWPG